MKFPTGQIFHIPFSSHSVLYVASISLTYLFKLYFMLTFTIKKSSDLYNSLYTNSSTNVFSIYPNLCQPNMGKINYLKQTYMLKI